MIDGVDSSDITYLNPEIISIFKNEDFSVNYSGDPFSEIAVNMALE